uniref:Uncharacterized protein n=1 Tax=viral metagenome TaxID=1070528 RepID=A0A6C0DDZ9_9ZZZZ
MKSIKEIISKYVRTFTSMEMIYPKLGRWNVKHNTTMIHFKIDQANADHSCSIIHEFEEQKEDKYLSYYL